MSRKRIFSGRAPRALIAVYLFLIICIQTPFAAFAAAYDGEISLSTVCVGADGKRYQIMISCGEDAGIPENASLVSSAIIEEDAAFSSYAAQACETLGYYPGGEHTIRLFDISVVDRDDPSVCYQPEEGACVELKVRLAAAPENELNVVHFGETPEVLESAVNGRTVSVETTGFSVYAFVEARAADAAFSGVFKGDLSDLDGKTLYISNKRSATEYFLIGAPAAANWLAQTNSQNNAQAFTFHRKEGSEDLFAISFEDNTGTVKYLKLTTTAMEISDEPYYFKATKDSRGVWLFQMGDGSNNYMNHNDANGFTRWKDGYSDAGNRIILPHIPQEIPDDPFGLNGRTYGIGKVLSSTSGSLTGVAISNEINSNNRLGADVMAQLSMSAGNSLG